MSVVLDASAVLAALWREPGADRVEAALNDAQISAVNLSELVAKLVDRGATAQNVRDILAGIGAQVVDFTAEQAVNAGLIRHQTKALGLSLGDRACLALARLNGATVLTADRVWAHRDLGVDIEVIR